MSEERICDTGTRVEMEVTDKDIGGKAIITPAPEHDPRYNVSADKLKEANEKLKNISEAKEQILESSVQGKTNVEIKGDKILSKRTPNDYNRIWNAFLQDQADAFMKHMGYTIKTIKRIGFHKFIDAMDWKNEKDIWKWRTDKLHIVPCCHCKRDFAVYEDLALCDKCKPQYDLEYFYRVMAHVEAEQPGHMWEQKMIFIKEAGIRSMYLKKKKIQKGRSVNVSTDELMMRRIQNEHDEKRKEEAGTNDA